MLKQYMISLGYKEDEFDIIRNTYPVVKCGDEFLYLAVRNFFSVIS